MNNIMWKRKILALIWYMDQHSQSSSHRATKDKPQPHAPVLSNLKTHSFIFCNWLHWRIKSWRVKRSNKLFPVFLTIIINNKAFTVFTSNFDSEKCFIGQTPSSLIMNICTVKKYFSHFPKTNRRQRPIWEGLIVSTPRPRCTLLPSED